jgi:hypothetical protein
MKTKAKAAVSVVVNVGKEVKRRVTRKRKPRRTINGLPMPPLRGIYDNANERAIHYSNFPAQRVIHEQPPNAYAQPPVQQWFMNPPTPQLKLESPKVEDVSNYLGAAIPQPNFNEPKAEFKTDSNPLFNGGAEQPHVQESFVRSPYNLRPDPRRLPPYTPRSDRKEKQK